MAASPSSPRTVLGVCVTPQTLDAVVLRATTEGTTVLHRMVRPRLRFGEAKTTDNFSGVLPGMKSSDDVDFTLEVGEGSSELDLDNPALTSLRKGAASGEGPKLFVAQLREMLSECRSLGFGTPDLAFCVDAPEVAQVDVTLGATTASDRGPVGTLWERVSRVASRVPAEMRPLLDALKAQYDAPFDPKRVSFVPLGTEDDEQHVLALVPTAAESVTPTLRALSATDETLGRAAHRLDAEVSLLADIVATHVDADTAQNTAVVRVGGNDTLLLFLRGRELRHVEHLRSLTAFDPAETICSRVLLHQDACRIDTIHHVVLVGGPRDGRLTTGVAAFYDDATIHELNDILREEVSLADDLEDGLTPNAGLAIAAGLRLLEDAPANLLGPAPRARRPSALGWHTVAVLMLLGAASLFFGWRYMERAQAVAALEQQIAMSPVEMPEMTPETLKHRVDSLNAVHAKHNRALHVLDSLLLGSDEWTRAIERTARQTEQIEGVWFDNWSIDATSITLQGHALKRSALAALARNLDGTIRELKFTDIQGARAYPFTVTIPRRIEMPEVTVRLRENALTPTEPPGLQQVSQP